MRRMPIRPLRRSLTCLSMIALACAGCAQTRRYNVQVLNRTNDPITIGLAKEGRPFEPQLASPEELALGTPASDENLWPSEVVAPGRVAYTRVEGKFDGKSELLLRVYAGKRTLSEILAVPRGSGERVETVLRPEPALNKIVVTRQENRLQAEPVDQLPQAQPAEK
jgi:hypothetical protein